MPIATTSPTFFGMDTHELRQGFAQAWQRLAAPVARWLTPAVAVRWRRADGADQTWRTDGSRTAALRSAPSTGKGDFIALQPPEDLLLRRTVPMPRLPQAALQQAVALELLARSPFAAPDLVSGWTAPAMPATGPLAVEIILASRPQLLAWLASQSAQGSTEPELWCPAASGAPIVLQGFGEARRTRAHARGKAASAWLLGLAAVLLLAAALTPTLQLRARALQAVAAYDKLAHSAAPALQQREALTRSQEQLAGLAQLLADQVDPLQVLDLITQALPDDTTLGALKLQGLKLSLTGQTGNAAALMQRLGSHPALREVKAPSAATRPPGATRDSFAIEALVDAQALRPQISETLAEPAPQPASQPPAPPPAPAAAPGKSAFSIGGGA